MSSERAAWEIEDITRELDLLVFRLEIAPETPWEDERRELRRQLDRLRERLQDALRQLN